MCLLREYPVRCGRSKKVLTARQIATLPLINARWKIHASITSRNNRTVALCRNRIGCLIDLIMHTERSELCWNFAEISQSETLSYLLIFSSQRKHFLFTFSRLCFIISVTILLSIKSILYLHVRSLQKR